MSNRSAHLCPCADELGSCLFSASQSDHQFSDIYKSDLKESCGISIDDESEDESAGANKLESALWVLAAMALYLLMVAA